MAKKEKKVFLKLKRPHKSGFRLGRHIIKAGIAREFSLDEKEQKELMTVGPQAWLLEVSKKQMDAKPKSNQENKQMQAIIKEIKDRVELTGEETLKELEEIKNEIAMFDSLVKELKEKGVEVSGKETVEELEQLLSDQPE